MPIRNSQFSADGAAAADLTPNDDLNETGGYAVTAELNAGSPVILKVQQLDHYDEPNSTLRIEVEDWKTLAGEIECLLEGWA